MKNKMYLHPCSTPSGSSVYNNSGWLQTFDPNGVIHIIEKEIQKQLGELKYV